MGLSPRRVLRTALFLTSALAVLSAGLAARAADAAPAAQPAATDAPSSDIVVTLKRTTRSSVSLGAIEIQKILPGVSPLKAIQTLPGVLFETADPWGNNEQNEALFVHGFSTQQLGYTMDGVPLGDQQYGNYNGLSVSRALTSENTGRVLLSSGAGDLGVASTSNLGGAIETFSADPTHERGARIDETLGSYKTTRTFVRLDTGEFMGGNTAYVTYLHQDQKAWDFNGHQKGDQVNAKYVHDGEAGKLTVFFDYSNKVEPNEDATNFGIGTSYIPYTPYTRPFLYPDLKAGLSYLDSNGAPKAAATLYSNFSNYYSAAQREDYLGYAKYDWNLNPNVTWSNQLYYHHDEGRGLVAGPVNQAGLPTLFAVYFPGQNLVNVFGGTGYEVRETEYLIDRGGLISTMKLHYGGHDVELGGWYERVNSQTDRNWFPFAAANNDLTPYSVPKNPAFTQYESQISNNVFVFHLQDQWRIREDLLLQAGFKSSLQFARGSFPVEQLPAKALPQGEIDTREYFLPQVGAVWDATAHEQLFFNVQENMRQYITYGAGGLSPWSLATQAAFDLFKDTVHPEKSWTYEVGLRSHRALDLGPLTGYEMQASYYHVDFSNRLLNIAAYNFINPGAAILANVGSVSTDGVDIAGTLHFGQHFAFYDAVSYNRSIYDQNYISGAAGIVTKTAGKSVPDSPDWMNKFVASTNFGPFEAQISGDYVGKRYATYINDISVKSYFLLGLEASYRFNVPAGYYVKSSKVSVNVTNLTNERGISTIGSPTVSSTYSGFPIPPTQFFVSLSAQF
ncbi:MAG: TonB-dependent receptor [Caulobacteraceae bacterium]|nr:TonB-dependent receptor [Caulobacteraceae bacterium]